MSTTTATPIATGNWKIDRVHSHVGFAVKHMVVSTYRGSFDEYDGRLAVGDDGAPRLEGFVAVDSIQAKDENLKAHVLSPDFFDSASHPRITFTSREVSIGDGGELEVLGDLEIKGHTHPVTAQGSISGPHVDIAGNEKVGVELQATVDRRDYGLDWQEELPGGGDTLGWDVTLEALMEFAEQA